MAPVVRAALNPCAVSAIRRCFGSCQEELQDRPRLTVATKARKSANIASGCSNAAKCPRRPSQSSGLRRTSSPRTTAAAAGTHDREKRRCRSGPRCARPTERPILVRATCNGKSTLRSRPRTGDVEHDVVEKLVFRDRLHVGAAVGLARQVSPFPELFQRRLSGTAII